MFFRKITSRSKGKEYTYLKLIENYREGGKVKQRVVANLGSLENLTPEKVEGLISGLSRICGLPGDSLQLESKKVLQYGEVMALHKIWEILGLTEAIKEAAGSSHQDLNLPLLLELMAINQAVKPPYKQAVSDWYRYLYLPELEGRELLPHHFYRALDIAGGVKDDLERQVFKKLSSFTAVDADVVFCRLTAGVVESPPREELSLSGYGRYFLEEAAEENKVDFGLLVSRDGIPLGHKMLSQAAEENEFRDIINYARNNFGADRCVFVGDRSFVSHPGLEVLVAHGHEYLLCHKALNALDRNLVAGETAGGLKDFREVNDELYFKEIEEGGLRFLLCYNLKAAKQKKMLLDERLHEVEEELKAIRAEAGRREPGARFAFNKNAAVFKDKHFLKYFNWHYSETAGEFSYQRRDDLIEQERDLAGLFILETNSRALEGGELLHSYAGLSQLGESFREIKSFEARPNKLKAELNISANIFICVLASAMEKALERTVRRAGINLNARQVLNLLEEIKVTVNELGGREVRSVTSVDKVQREILQAMGIGDPKRSLGNI